MDVAAGSGGKIYWTCTVAGGIAVADEISQSSGGFSPGSAIDSGPSGSTGISTANESRSSKSGNTSASGTGFSSGINPPGDVETEAVSESVRTATDR